MATIWFILWGLLWAVYFVLDGYDLGIGSLLPCLAKNESERRIMYNAAGPFWDANEVWLISAGGVTFAAFPKTYAVMFSAFYIPLLLLLFVLIFRAVSFEFRNKIDSAFWRGLWDKIHFISNLLAALLLGVAFANLFKGIPVDADGVFHGTLFTFLSVYGLAGGIFFVLMFAMHGALWLCIKAGGDLQVRAAARARKLWSIILVYLVCFLILTAMFTNLFSNYFHCPVLFVFPVLALVALFRVKKYLQAQNFVFAWGSSAVFILAVTFFGVAGMYPNMIISTLDPAVATITAQAAASSPLTLKIMLGVALVMVPIVLVYQFWVHRMFSHRLTAADVEQDKQAY